MTSTGEVFFTSDHHFDHGFLAKWRGFSCRDEMNEILIERWNERIKKKSVRVYHLGDIFLGRKSVVENVLKRLNGTIYLIRGNHDSLAESRDIREKFVWIKDMHYFKIATQKIMICHYPLLSWRSSKHGAFHFHGHCHGSLNGSNRFVNRLDVGVDTNEFYPYHFDEIKRILSGRANVDHHSADSLGVSGGKNREKGDDRLFMIMHGQHKIEVKEVSAATYHVVVSKDGRGIRGLEFLNAEKAISEAYRLYHEWKKVGVVL